MTGRRHVSEDKELRERLHREAAAHLDNLAKKESDPAKRKFWGETATATRLSGGLLWTTQQCAEHCGVSASTYRDYVGRLGAPRPVAQDPDRQRDQDLYDAEAVRRWYSNRAGQGRRTELRRK